MRPPLRSISGECRGARRLVPFDSLQLYPLRVPAEDSLAAQPEAATPAGQGVTPVQAGQSPSQPDGGAETAR